MGMYTGHDPLSWVKHLIGDKKEKTKTWRASSWLSKPLSTGSSEDSLQHKESPSEKDMLRTEEKAAPDKLDGTGRRGLLEDQVGHGPGEGVDTEGMTSMADTAFGATDLGQAIGKGLATVAKGALSLGPFGAGLLGKVATHGKLGYEPSAKGWAARGNQEGLAGPVGTSAGGTGPPGTAGGGASAGFGGASTPGSISGGGHDPSAGQSNNPNEGWGGGEGSGGGGSGGSSAGTSGGGASAGFGGAGNPGSIGGGGHDPGVGAGAGGAGGGGGCIIVSACTNPYSYEVNVTRAFRDAFLTPSMLRGYYALARKVVPFIDRFGFVKAVVKRGLVDRLIDYGEHYMGLKPEREKVGSRVVSQGFLRLIRWIGRR